MQWQKVNNGHTLTIKMDTDALIRHLDERIQDFQDEQKEIDAGSADITDNQWERGVVYGNTEDDFFDISECITDLEDMKDTILKLAADEEGSSIWPTVCLKKNGTFKRNAKAIIKEEKFGPYWEDSYGWNVEVLRMEPASDTEINIVLTDVVMHY